MTEQIFDLDIKIDDKMWWNFSTHPSRTGRGFHAPIVQQPVREEPLKNKPEDVPLKSIDEVVQGSEPFDTKIQKLVTGQFQVDRETKPKYHFLMNFEDKGGFPLILAMPSFTNQDVNNYFDAKERAALEPVPKPEPVIDLPPTLPPQEPTLTEQTIDTSAVKETIREQEQVPQELPKETEVPKPRVQEKEVIPEVQKTSTPEPHVAPEPTRAPPTIVPEKEPVQESTTRLETPPIPKEEVAAKIVREEPLIEKAVDRRVEPQEEKVVEVPKIKPRFTGQILANNLLSRIMFDSFHYVKVGELREQPNFIMNKFLRKKAFDLSLKNSDREYGPHHVFRSYFSEGILKSSYLMNRYFKNPVIVVD